MTAQPYAYLRKSSVRDLDREESHEVQEAAVRALAARHGDADDLILLEDWDKSGRLGADKRPGYRALLDAIESGRASAVYSYSLSRLSRSVKELARLVEDCDAKGIPVRLDKDVIDTGTASGRLTANVLGSVSQFESEVAGERVRGALAARRARGEKVSTTPFYGDKPGEDPAAVLRAFDEAGSFSGAAKLLNEWHVRPSRAKPRRVAGPRSGKVNEQEQAIWWPSSVAVVVRRLRPELPTRAPSRGVAAGGSDFILSRILRCPTCGTRLTGTRDRKGRRVRYMCRLGSVTPHARLSVTESHILPAVQAEVARLRAPEAIETVASNRERARLEGRRRRVVDAYVDGLFGDGAEAKVIRDQRLADVDAALAKLTAEALIVAVPTIDWTWTPRTLNKVLRAVFEAIEVDPATFQPIEFTWTVAEWRA
jgi:DNA invertase Pin-like site-specific DNA recombinase